MAAERITSATAPTMPGPLLIGRREAAWLAGRSIASWDRGGAAVLVPEAIRMGVSGKTKRYRRSEIVAWIDAGCPNRKTWSAMQAEHLTPLRPRQGHRAAGVGATENEREAGAKEWPARCRKHRNGSMFSSPEFYDISCLESRWFLRTALVSNQAHDLIALPGVGGLPPP